MKDRKKWQLKIIYLDNSQWMKNVNSSVHKLFKIMC